jgi:hypothetical protein
MSRVENDFYDTLDSRLSSQEWGYTQVVLLQEKSKEIKFRFDPFLVERKSSHARRGEEWVCDQLIITCHDSRHHVMFCWTRQEILVYLYPWRSDVLFFVSAWNYKSCKSQGISWILRSFKCQSCRLNQKSRTVDQLVWISEECAIRNASQEIGKEERTSHYSVAYKVYHLSICLLSYSSFQITKLIWLTQFPFQLFWALSNLILYWYCFLRRSILLS